jgi:predicted MFS family arabinose efflux permease
MLIGIIITPRLTACFGVRRIIVAALLFSTLALAMLPFFPQAYWIPAALLLGGGLGLRWIALEPWLYQIAPEKARGRLIGLHETLIALSERVLQQIIFIVFAIKIDPHRADFLESVLGVKVERALVF